MTAPVEAVLLDVGGVFMVPAHEPILGALGRYGVQAADLDRAHYAAVAALDALGRVHWPAYVDGYVRAAGVPDDSVAEAAAALAEVFDTAEDLWSRVLPGSVEALVRLAATGVPLGIVSNSDGTVEAALVARRVCQVGAGEGTQVAVVVDSHLAGIEKPDPGIFAIALESLGVDPAHALHVGDTACADVAGARAAGIRAVHLDPHRLCPDPTDHDHARSLDDVTALVLRTGP
ncbi:MAG: putative hydrolase of the superfamily [Acidimicrobiaceae bacterium]|nr:putative hydrolase of the superfamily [Acidimicrobiaceae bacterium]